jgi:hypothetical protein
MATPGTDKEIDIPNIIKVEPEEQQKTAERVNHHERPTALPDRGITANDHDDGLYNFIKAEDASEITEQTEEQDVSSGCGSATAVNEHTMVVNDEENRSSIIVKVEAEVDKEITENISSRSGNNVDVKTEQDNIVINIETEMDTWDFVKPEQAANAETTKEQMKVSGNVDKCGERTEMEVRLPVYS